MTTDTPERVTGEFVTRWMEEHGYATDADLAQALGVARTTVFNWRHGEFIKPWLGPALDGLAARRAGFGERRRGPVKVEVEVDPDTGEANVVRSRKLTRAR